MPRPAATPGAFVLRIPHAGAVGHVVYRLTKPMMQGPIVERIQRCLRDASFDPGTIDGLFSPETQAAVIAFRLSNGLVPDGEVGPATAAKLGFELPAT